MLSVTNFAALTLPELVPIFGLFATMLAGFYGITQVILKQSKSERDSDRDERKLFVAAIENMAASSGRVADTNQDIASAVTKQAVESAERNGHLGEMITEQSKQTAALTEMAVAKVIEGVQNVTTQNVIKQNIKQSNVKEETVEHETVKDKE
jgi:hypothetical protein